MVIVPSSTITLYKNVDVDNEETLSFSSIVNQTAYFQSRIMRQVVPCTVVKKTGSLRLAVLGTVVAQCNYLSFINPDFDNKTIYARITDYNYINNECVEIDYAIDAWQTWMFDVTIEDTYIEREHISQADYAKAEINPYDPTIPEFWTAEALPMSHDLEKESYDIGDDDSHDGYYVGAAVTDAFSFSTGIGALIMLADIDFEDLDTGSTGTSRKSYQFVQLLDSIISSTPSSFYELSVGVYDYLHTNYPSTIQYRTAESSNWTSASLVPSDNTRITKGYTTIFIDDAGFTEFSQLLNYLTTWNAVDQIINMFAVPVNLIALSAVYNSQQYIGALRAGVTVPTTQLWSKKLLRYPYSFLRLISPNGDKKELQYEYFTTAQNGSGACYIDLFMDTTERPTLIAAPDGYRMAGLSPWLDSDANIDEGLVLKQFPTLPYNIDAFTAQMASVAVDIIGNMTAERAWDLTEQEAVTNLQANNNILTGSIISNLSGIGKSLLNGDLSGVANSMGSALTTMGTTQKTSGQMVAQRGKFNVQQNAWNDAYATLGGEKNSIYGAFGKLTRPAYACNEYHMSNGDGMINYSKLNYQDIIVLRASLNDRVMAMYDTWFKNYGYSSGRCGVPRIMNFIHGSSTASDLPQWVTINNKPTTYVKTTDCKVIHSMVPVAEAIRSMFNSGVRFINGDGR